MDLTISEKLQIIIKRKGLKVGEICETLGCTRQNLYKKLGRDSWTETSLAEICKALDIDYDVVFTDNKTGTKI